MPAIGSSVRSKRLKSPSELARTLTRYWHDAGKRERQLLHPDAWPLLVSIGRPTATSFTKETARVREHVEQWRAAMAGEVITESVRFRSGAEPVVVPTSWSLASASEWADATCDSVVQAEYAYLSQLLEATPPLFHRLLVRQRSLWRGRPVDDVVQATALALELEPGMAAGRPMRSLALAGVDSKFMERYGSLLTTLLDVRFDGQASRSGLVRFLDAADEGEHWLLIAPLCPGLMPFARQRVRARELLDVPLPAGRILVVENERCLHLLPAMANTIAVLGAGLNLTWLGAPWLNNRRIGYWGDLDTWGLSMLAQARRLQPQLEAFLMSRDVFDAHASLAVPEVIQASAEPPEDLTTSEQALYRHLCSLEKGRLEQEFLSEVAVGRAFAPWGNAT